MHGAPCCPPTRQVLCNVTKHRGGLEAALAASMVETLIGLLKEGKPAEVQREACVTLAIACFDDMAKITAIQVRLTARSAVRVVDVFRLRPCTCACVCRVPFTKFPFAL